MDTVTESAMAIAISEFGAVPTVGNVLCGHLGGGKGILIEPIDRVRDEASVMKRRAAETKMLHRLGIRQFCETDSDAQSAASQKNS